MDQGINAGEDEGGHQPGYPEWDAEQSHKLDVPPFVARETASRRTKPARNPAMDRIPQYAGERYGEARYISRGAKRHQGRKASRAALRIL